MRDNDAEREAEPLCARCGFTEGQHRRNAFGSCVRYLRPLAVSPAQEAAREPGPFGDVLRLLRALGAFDRAVAGPVWCYLVELAAEEIDPAVELFEALASLRHTLLASELRLGELASIDADTLRGHLAHAFPPENPRGD